MPAMQVPHAAVESCSPLKRSYCECRNSARADLVASGDRCQRGQLGLSCNNLFPVLAAFADRGMIVKGGVLISMMAGSLGGGRITTFPYGEVTGTA